MMKKGGEKLVDKRGGYLDASFKLLYVQWKDILWHDLLWNIVLESSFM